MATKILIDEATPEQLRKFARDYLGINHPSHTKPETTLAAVKDGWAQPHILVDDGAEPAEQAPVSRAQPAATAVEPEPEIMPEPETELPEPMVRLVLGEQPGAGGKRAVPVGVNGVAMLIPRNIECEVKLRYFEALKDAVETHHEQDESTGDMTSRDIVSYPYSVIRMPSPAEIAAWKVSLAKAEKRARIEAAKIRAAQSQAAA